MDHHSRRAFLSATATGLLGATTGCLSGQSPPNNGPSKTDSSTTTTNSINQQPGYIGNHWHGRLFLDIDGDLLQFHQPKYYLHNLEAENPDAVYFHFHKGQHGANEWSNEKRTVTLEQGLNLLPDINYNRYRDSHVISVNGTEYRGFDRGVSIDIYRDTEPVDPSEYTVQNRDHFWIKIRTNNTDESRNRTGRLVVDFNNLRKRYAPQTLRDTDTDRFEITATNDGRHRWVNTGDTITFADALNAVPNLEYSFEDGHALTNDARPDYSGTFTADSQATTLLFRQRMHAVDPREYELQDDDILWVYVHSKRLPDNNNSFIETNG